MAERRTTTRATDGSATARRAARRHRREPSNVVEPSAAEPNEPEDMEPGEPEDMEPGEPEDMEPGEPEDMEPGEPEAVEEVAISRRAGTRPGRQARRRGSEHAVRANGSALTAQQAAAAALGHVVEMTARQAEGITEVGRTEDGWMVGVEVVEDRRIPSSSDILATYQATIDADGELISYRRLRRYARGRGDPHEGS